MGEEGENVLYDGDQRGKCFPKSSALGAERDLTLATHDEQGCVTGPRRRDLQGVGFRYSRVGAYAGKATRECFARAYDVPVGQGVVCGRPRK